MQSSLLATLLSACALLAACDDELESLQREVPVLDAGELAIKVRNVGASCSLWNRSCEGSAAQCLEISYSGAFYPGGYCTADCAQSEECGPGAACPVGEAQRVASNYRFRSTWARKCFQTCRPGVPGTCRGGYACLSLAEVYAAEDAPAPMHTPVCVPRRPSLGGDAGSPFSIGRTLDAGP